MAAEANNSFLGTGVAFGAMLAGMLLFIYKVFERHLRLRQKNKIIIKRDF